MLLIKFIDQTKKPNLLHLFHTTSILLRSANMRFENFQACVKVTRCFPLSFLVRHIVLNHKYPGFVLVYVLAPGRRFHNVVVAVFGPFVVDACWFGVTT